MDDQSDCIVNINHNSKRKKYSTDEDNSRSEDSAETDCKSRMKKSRKKIIKLDNEQIEEREKSRDTDDSDMEFSIIGTRHKKCKIIVSDSDEADEIELNTHHAAKKYISTKKEKDSCTNSDGPGNERSDLREESALNSKLSKKEFSKNEKNCKEESSDSESPLDRANDENSKENNGSSIIEQIKRKQNGDYFSGVDKEKSRISNSINNIKLKVSETENERSNMPTISISQRKEKVKIKKEKKQSNIPSDSEHLIDENEASIDKNSSNKISVFSKFTQIKKEAEKNSQNSVCEATKANSSIQVELEEKIPKFVTKIKRETERSNMLPISISQKQEKVKIKKEKKQSNILSDSEHLIDENEASKDENNSNKNSVFRKFTQIKKEVEKKSQNSVCEATKTDSSMQVEKEEKIPKFVTKTCGKDTSESEYEINLRVSDIDSNIEDKHQRLKKPILKKKFKIDSKKDNEFSRKYLIGKQKDQFTKNNSEYSDIDNEGNDSEQSNTPPDSELLSIENKASKDEDILNENSTFKKCTKIEKEAEKKSQNSVCVAKKTNSSIQLKRKEEIPKSVTETCSGEITGSDHEINIRLSDIDSNIKDKHEKIISGKHERLEKPITMKKTTTECKKNIGSLRKYIIGKQDDHLEGNNPEDSDIDNQENERQENGSDNSDSEEMSDSIFSDSDSDSDLRMDYSSKLSYKPTPEERLYLINLQVQLQHEVPPQHRLERRTSCHLKKALKREFEKHTTLKRGYFSTDEDIILKKNWKTFCKIHNWDPKNPKPFLQLKHKGKVFYMSQVNRLKFIQFLARGLPNRCLYSVYHRYKRLYYKHKTSRYKPYEDATILDFVKKQEKNGQKNKQDRKFADLALILDRTAASVWRRYRLLKKNMNVNDCDSSE